MRQRNVAAVADIRRTYRVYGQNEIEVRNENPIETRYNQMYLDYVRQLEYIVCSLVSNKLHTHIYWVYNGRPSCTSES